MKGGKKKRCLYQMKTSFFRTMICNAFTKNGYLKEGYTRYKEFNNKLAIKLNNWTESLNDWSCHQVHRYLYLLMCEPYEQKWLNSQQSKINKDYVEKEDKRLNIARNKFEFLKTVYFLMFDPKTDFCKDLANSSEEIKTIIEANRNKKVYSTNEAIEKANKELKITHHMTFSRTEYFRLNDTFMKQIVTISNVKHKVKVFMKKFCPRDKTPRTLAHSKYSEGSLKLVAKAFDSAYERLCRMNVQTLVYKIRKAAQTGEKLEDCTFWPHIFSEISQKTVLKALVKYSKYRFLFLKSKKWKKVLLRNYRLEKLGHCQLDLKTFTNKEYRMSCKRMYSIDLIDEASNFMYAKLTEHPTAENIVDFLEEAIEYFKKHGIEIKQIKTDSCNIFAAKAGAKHQKFENCLKQRNINHVLIPFQKPQHNGKVERLHKTYDDELKHMLYHKTFEECQEIFKNYVSYFNFERITNSVIRNPNKQSNVHFLSQKMIPIDVVNSINNLNKTH